VCPCAPDDEATAAAQDAFIDAETVALATG
jgi:hypothetical protein